MSGTGISPSDVFGGLRIAHKAISAIKRKDGARDQYQAVKLGRDELRAVLEALADNAASSTTRGAIRLRDCLGTRLKTQAQQEQRLGKFETVLEQDSSRARRWGILRKLQSDVQEDGEL